MTTASIGKAVILDRETLRRMGEVERRRRDAGEDRLPPQPGVPWLKPFDAEAVRDALVEAIRNEVHGRGFERVVVGISGGKDSSVTAALCARALGRENVLGVMMPDGMQADADDAREVIDALGIPSIEANVGIAHAVILEAIPHAMPDGFGIEEGNAATADTNLVPRLRMATLRYACQATGSLLAGTGNLSEIHLGYFTKDGDSSCDVAVLASLTSVEVVEVGRTMGELPRHLVDKPPADGLCGMTDEERLGISYADVHNLLRCGTSGKADADRRIRELSEATSHKRGLPRPVLRYPMTH